MAQQGDNTARTTLALMLLNGEIVPGRRATGLFWLNRAAESGNCDAQVALADLLRDGTPAEHDSRTAALWYSRAGSCSAYAAWRLGQLFETGEGVLRDEAAAVRLYREAAARGLAVAENSLGNAYIAGMGVEPNFAAAREWYGKAAEHGYADALLNLAGMYYRGLGGPRDLQEAYSLALYAAMWDAHDAPAFLFTISASIQELDKSQP